MTTLALVFGMALAAAPHAAATVPTTPDRTVAVAEADAKARTEALINAFKKVKVAKEGQTLTEAERKANEAAFVALDGFMDFDRLTTEVIAPHKDKLTPEQLTQFHQLFKELVRMIAYPKSGSAFNDAQYTFAPPTKRADGGWDVAMTITWPAEDLTVEVAFHWAEASGALRLYDVSFDGDSLIRDYQNQFGRIIEKEGAAGLMKKLETRKAEEQAKMGAPK
jgi:ABC-type transporter MlaC component